MEQHEPTREELFERIRTLEERLWEAEQTIEAIQSGEVDALVIQKPEGEQLYTLTGADHGYRMLVESVSEGALILSSDDSIYYCNLTLGEMLRLPLQKIIGRRLDSFVAVEARPQLMELIKESHRLGVARGEFQIQRNGETPLPVNVSLNRFSMEGFDGVCAVIADLSEQKRVEEELRRHRTELELLVNDRTTELQQEIIERKRAEEEVRGQHEWLRVTLNSIGDAVIATDAAARITFINPVAAHLTGWRDEEARRKSVHEVFTIINEKTREPAEDVVRRVLHNGSGTLLANHTALVTRDRREIPIEDNAAPIKDSAGNVLGMVLVFHDVTERRRVQEVLRQSEERLQALMKALPVGVSFSDDADCRFIAGNPAVLAQFEVGPEDNLSASAADRNVPGRQVRFFREGREISDAELPLQRAIAENQEISPMELEVLLPSGRRWIAEASGAPLRNAEGKVVGGVAVTVDVTERKLAVEALRQSESRFRLLSETAGQLLASQNPQRIVEELCKDVMDHLDCHVFFNFLVDEPLGKLRLNACAGIPDEEARRIEWLDYGVAVCGCVAQTGERIVAEDIFHTPDIRTELVKSYGIQAYACHPLMVGDRLIGTLSFGTRSRSRFSPPELVLMKTVADQVATAMERISLIRELEKSRDELETRVRERTAELSKANEEIRDLYNNAPCGYHSLGPDGTYLQINETELKWLGYTRDEIIGKKKWSDLLAPESLAIFQTTFALFKSRGWIKDQDFELICRDGTILPVALSATAVMDAQGAFLFSRSTTFDITERRRGEEQTLRARALLQTVFDGISEPLLMINSSLSVLMLNEAARGYFEIGDGEDATGKSCRELSLGKCGPCGDCPVSSAITEGRKATIERKGPFDPERLEEITVYPADQAVGGISGAIVRISDVTESRNMERHLTRADRLSSLGVIAGGIAHEIRNPLAGINLFIDVLSDEERYSRTGKELEVFDEIKANIRRINDIIIRVLDFSRQSQSSTMKTVNMGLLIEDTLKLWQTKMVKAGIRLQLEVEEDLAEVLCDPVEIRQVLTNLIQNAVEAIEQDGVLEIIAEGGTLSFDRKRPAVIIQVADSGPGIPLSQQKHMFNPFFTTKQTGTGLGLAISQRIISRHGGLISFTSLPDEKTTFAIELPVARENGCG